MIEQASASAAIVVAAGGDGTVRSVASAVLGSAGGARRPPARHAQPFRQGSSASRSICTQAVAVVAAGRIGHVDVGMVERSRLRQQLVDRDLSQHRRRAGGAAAPGTPQVAGDGDRDAARAPPLPRRDGEPRHRRTSSAPGGRRSSSSATTSTRSRGLGSAPGRGSTKAGCSSISRRVCARAISRCCSRRRSSAAPAQSGEFEIVPAAELWIRPVAVAARARRLRRRGDDDAHAAPLPNASESLASRAARGLSRCGPSSTSPTSISAGSMRASSRRSCGLVHEIAPDLVAISGDLTQRARRRQFQQARAFLDQLPLPQLVVPGNHDVPLFNVAARFVDPYGGYRRYVSPDLEPVYEDAEMVAVGLNSARSLPFRWRRPVERGAGRRARRRGCGRRAPDAVRIIVTHHPFDLPAGHRRRPSDRPVRHGDAAARGRRRGSLSRRPPPRQPRRPHRRAISDRRTLRAGRAGRNALHARARRSEHDQRPAPRACRDHDRAT